MHRRISRGREPEAIQTIEGERGLWRPAFSGDTGQMLASKGYFVPAHSSFQVGADDLLGPETAASDFYLQFTVTGGAGRVIPYAAPIDNTPGDTTYIAAR